MVTIVGIVAILVLMAFDPDQQQAIGLSALSAVVIIVAGLVVQRRHAGHAAGDRYASRS